MNRLALCLLLAAVIAVGSTGCATRVVRTDTTAPAATVVTTTPGTTTVITSTTYTPVCGGAWSPTGGTNFGACAK